MSLFYRCDCCGATIHKLGADGGKRLNLCVGELMDDAQDSENKRTLWTIEEYPLIQVDLCRNCYNELIGRIRDLRVARGLTVDLTEVSIGGSSV